MQCTVASQQVHHHELINNQTNVAINNTATSYLVVLISRSYKVKVTVNLADLTTHALMRCYMCSPVVTWEYWVCVYMTNGM